MSHGHGFFHLLIDFVVVVTFPYTGPQGHSLACVLSHVQFFATQWPVTCQVPMSVGFPKQEH